MQMPKSSLVEISIKSFSHFFFFFFAILQIFRENVEVAFFTANFLLAFSE